MFWRDLSVGLVERVSVSSSGQEGNDDSFGGPFVSDDGRLVAFYSSASNLVADDFASFTDCFLRDVAAGVTRRVSTTADGGEIDHHSFLAGMSGDGEVAVMVSRATNLFPGDVYEDSDVFLWGPELGFDVTPGRVPPGGTVTLSAWGAAGGSPMALVLEGIQGNPVFQVILLGGFDASGLAQISGSAPASLSGTEIDLRVLGFGAGSRLLRSNRDSVSF